MRDRLKAVVWAAVVSVILLASAAVVWGITADIEPAALLVGAAAVSAILSLRE